MSLCVEAPVNILTFAPCRRMNKAVSSCLFIFFYLIHPVRQASLIPAVGSNSFSSPSSSSSSPWPRLHPKGHSLEDVLHLPASENSAHICEHNMSIYSNICNICPSIIFHPAAHHFDSSLDVILLHRVISEISKEKQRKYENVSTVSCVSCLSKSNVC